MRLQPVGGHTTERCRPKGRSMQVTQEAHITHRVEGRVRRMHGRQHIGHGRLMTRDDQCIRDGEENGRQASRRRRRRRHHRPQRG